MRWGVLLRKYKTAATVGSETVKEVGLEVEVGGKHAWIDVRSATGSSRWRARISTEETDGIWAPDGFTPDEWVSLVTQAPTQGKHLQWSNDVTRLEAPEAGSVDEWWADQAAKAFKECLDPECTEVGGFSESASTVPDGSVLNPWVLEAFTAADERLKPITRCETTHESNPDWATEKHKGQVFRAGKLHEHAQAWKDFSACEKVLN